MSINRRRVIQLGLLAGTTAALAACTPAAPTPTATPGAWMPPTEPMPFPKGYTWGAATSAFQVEGSTTVDGRGVSIWDTFAAEPGRIRDGSTGNPGADQYNRWQDDIGLMQELGLGAYRFSIAWPRIQPLGTGAVNQKGIDFYRTFAEALIQAGIKPAATLYHWDLPQPLQDAGGWPVRDTAEAFETYSRIMFDALGDLDIDWFTINEPKTTSFVGHRYGAHAPGIADNNAAAASVHHQLLAHGLAVQQFRESGAKGRIGIALNLTPLYPVGDTAKEATKIVDAVENRLFLDPVLLGTYPDNAIGGLGGQLGADATQFEALQQPGDLEIISTPNDYLAVQFYGVAGVDFSGNQVGIHPTSNAEWQQIYPEGLYDLLTRIRDDYPAIPLVITENGMPDDTADLTTDDPYRVTFLREHFQQAARAINDGVPLEAHYVWSLLDNFEWAEGYTQRWGIIAVDFETQERTLKNSARFYKTVISANAVPAEER